MDLFVKAKINKKSIEVLEDNLEKNLQKGRGKNKKVRRNWEDD